MLLVHPSSQCDVCLDPYTWATPAKAPHAIQCGHVFCLDCLRSVSPTNCPLCRKAFNPERIKKLHVDKVFGGPAGPLLEENELFRRISALFDQGEDVDRDHINTLVEEVNTWVGQTTRSSDPLAPHPLRTAVTALHQYTSLQAEKTAIKKELSKLKAAHERHVSLKNKDIHLAMLVERSMLEASEKADAEMAVLRRENDRLQEELRRYTHPSNPLPPPPQLNPYVSSFYRHPTDTPSVPQDNAASSSTAAPSTHPQALSGSTAARPNSLQFVEPPAANDGRTKYKVTNDGRQLRREDRKRPHFIIPGAPHSARILPPNGPGGGDLDATPRASSAVPATPPLGMWAGDDWPYDTPDPRPRQGESCVWVGDPNHLNARFANQIDCPPPAPGPLVHNGHSQVPSGLPGVAHATQSAMTGDMQIASVPYVTRSARVQVDAGEGPVVDHTQPARRSRHVGEPGYVRVCYPAGQIRWVHKTKTANMAMREFGTQSDHAYIIAKHPSEVDEEWRGRNGGSPGHNPLQLSGVPDSTVAGSSTILPRREEDDSALSSTARQGSTLFHDQPDATVRSALGVSFSDYVGHAGADDGPVAGPSTVRGSRSRENDALGLNASSHPHPGQSTTARPVIQTTVSAETLSQPSPATSWGEESYRPSRRSSLSLHLNTFPSPRGSQRFSVSVEQLSINEFIGGGPVPVDVVADNASVPSRRSEDSREQGEFGLLFNSREGSSRHVVSGVQDLEDINHSLSQVSDRPQEDARSTQASRSSRQSRQPSISGHELDAIIGPRTGLALYGSGPAAHSSSGRPSADPSLASVPFLPNPRSPSRVSTRSRAESIHSHSSSGHSAGSHRSSGHRPRRSSVATSAHLREPFEAPTNSWAAEPRDTQPYASRGPYGDSHAQGSQDSIPRSLGSTESLGLGGIGGIGGVGGGGLMLTFEAPSTSAAVDRNGQAAAGIHAPRPLSSRHSSLVNVAWNSRNGH